MNFPAKIPPGSRQEIVPEGSLGGNPGRIFLSRRDLQGSCRDNGIPARIPAKFSFPGGILARFPLPDGIPAGNKFPGKNPAGILTRNSLGGETRRESRRNFPFPAGPPGILPRKWHPGKNPGEIFLSRRDPGKSPASRRDPGRK